MHHMKALLLVLYCNALDLVDSFKHFLYCTPLQNCKEFGGRDAGGGGGVEGGNETKQETF